MLPKTWSEIKKMIEDTGIKDEDRIFSIDLGPNCKKVSLIRDDAGVEITE